MSPVRLAQAIPRRWRVGIYSTLFALHGFELIWDLVGPELESKLLATVSLLGFGIAASNTGGKNVSAG